MGYIPPPPRGALTISATAPAPRDDTAWWDTVSGNLFRFDDGRGDWLPIGEAGVLAGLGGVALGRPFGAAGAGDVVIGENANVSGIG